MKLGWTSLEITNADMCALLTEKICRDYSMFEQCRVRGLEALSDGSWRVNMKPLIEEAPQEVTK
jgi:hypothetical protein